MSGTLIESPTAELKNIDVFDGDLDERAFERALGTAVLGWDVETTGLDWRSERIATVQLQVDEATYIVRVNGRVPHRLKGLLEDPTVLKVMHHAMFDLRFLVHCWDAAPSRVACTKIASKLAHQEAEAKDHSLAALVSRYFGATLDKTQRLSDWTASELNDAQVQYAAQDVKYLWPLYEKLDAEIRQRGLVSLRDRCYAHLFTRVELELRGYPDVFAY